jgi:hypothetical protein
MNPQDTPASEDRSSQAPTRKPYQKPQLQVYGDLAKITRALTSSGSNDGSGHPNMHFTS